VRNLDDTLEQVNIDEHKSIQSEYEITNAEKYKNLKESQFADPQNRAFPIDTEAHVKAAMSYLNQFYSNRPKKGVTADYSEKKFKEVHNRILRAMKKFGIEHNGCNICNKKKESRKGASSMENTVHEDVCDTEELREENEIVEPVTEAEDGTPAGSLTILEASLAEREIEIKDLKERTAALETDKKSLIILIARMTALASRGVLVSPEMASLISKLDNEEWDALFYALMSRASKEESVVETPVGEELQTEMPAEDETSDISEEAATEEIVSEEIVSEETVVAESSLEDEEVTDGGTEDEEEEETEIVSEQHEEIEEVDSEASVQEEEEEETAESTDETAETAAVGSLNLENEPNKKDAKYWKTIL